MNTRNCGNTRVRALNQTINTIRNIDPSFFNVSAGYRAEVFAVGLDSPIGMAFSDSGDLYIADSGINSGIAKVIRLRNGRFDVISQDFYPPITGISCLDGNIYVSHKGYITILRPNGSKQDIIAGIPCNGDYAISNIAFGPEGKIYFGLGTVTNSGVVGPDNLWVKSHPFLCDTPAMNITLYGQNFETDNIYIDADEKAYTGAFSPYGVPNAVNEVKKGSVKASGSILRSNRDGSNLELIAWGLRYPIHLEFNRDFVLYVSNRGYDVRGSRPIAHAPDEFYHVSQGNWYGWPDFSAGEPVTSPGYQPEGGKQPEFLLLNHPNVPPKPDAIFPPHSGIGGFAFNYNRDFGLPGEVYITEFGSYGAYSVGETTPFEGFGHKISKINLNNGEVSTFLYNKSGYPAYITGEGGFGRPIDIKFGPDGAMYILDFGISNPMMVNQFLSNSGVIWRVVKV